MQLTRARDEWSAARADAARAHAEADFERDRGNRLSSSLEMQRQQLESMMGSNAKYQALLGDVERRLAAAQAAAEEASDKASPPSAILAASRGVSSVQRPARVPSSAQPPAPAPLPYDRCPHPPDRSAGAARGDARRVALRRAPRAGGG